MFGHDDKNTNQEEHVTGDGGAVVQPISTSPPDENLVGVGPTSAPTVADPDNDDEDISQIVDDINATTSEAAPQTTSAEATEPVEAPHHEEPEQPAADQPADEPTLSETPAELMEVKKSALQELSPLLDELDQPADAKLNILMMTIQATDDHSLLPQALETAKKIEDKKARAEAMLDIIQEINYFTKKR